MNQDSSGGPDTFVPLQLVFRSVLLLSNKDLLSIIHEDHPPLIHKKLLMHVIYAIKIRFSRLFVAYKWNLNKESLLMKDIPTRVKFLYFRNLMIKLQEIGKYIQKHSITAPNPIEPPEIKIVKNPLSNNQFAIQNYLNSIGHKSITKIKISNCMAKFISKNKFDFAISFKSKLRLKSFNIYCSRSTLDNDLLKTIAFHLTNLISRSDEPVFQVSSFLDRICTTLLYADICKTFSKYQTIHKFLLVKDHLSIQLHFFELNHSFSLAKTGPSIFLYSNDKIHLKLRFQLNSISEIRNILDTIIVQVSSHIFQTFKKRIDEWIPSTSIYSTIINEKYRYLNFLFCEKPITHIYFSEFNLLTTDSPEFLKAIQQNDRRLFYQFIETFEYNYIAHLTGFSNSLLYDAGYFKRAILNVINSPVFSQYMPSFVSFKFIRKVHHGDLDQIHQFCKAIFAVNRHNFYTNLRNFLLQDRINSFLNGNKLIFNLETYNIVILKINETGFWQLMFTQPKTRLSVNMTIQFQGKHTNLRFGGWIHCLSHAVSSVEGIIDQVFDQFRNKTISVFHILRKTGLFFRTAVSLKNQSQVSATFLTLSPINYIGHDKDFDIFELGSSNPTIKMHFINYPMVDNAIRQTICNHQIDLIGSFLYYFFSNFPQVVSSFKDSGWLLSHLTVYGTFTLVIQKKYSLFFKQVGKNDFNVVVPLSGKSLILSIPLSAFPADTIFLDGHHHNQITEPLRQMTIRVSLSELSFLKESILAFFSDQKFLQNYGFSHLLFDAKNIIIKSGPNVTNQGWIKMSVSLGPNGLDFEILNDQSNMALYPFKQFLMMRCNNRSNRLKVLTFLFNCILIKQPTAFGLFSSLQILLDADEIRIDWEKSFMSSTVDVQNSLIVLKLYINNNEYVIEIDSKDEKDDSEDAIIRIFTPNGDITTGKRLRNDLRTQLQDFVTQEATDHQLYEFSFL